MGLILAHCGFQSVLVVFGHFAFYRLFQGAIYGIGLIFSYMVGLITGDFRLKTIFVIFNLLSADFFGGGAGGFYHIGAVHALGEGDCSVVAFGFAHNAASEIFGDGEGLGAFFQFNLSFACILADDGRFISVFVYHFVFQTEGAVVIANHVSGDVLLGGFWFCVIAQVLADFIGADLGDAGGVYRSFVGSGGDGAAVSLENRYCCIFHGAIDFMDFGGDIAFINVGIVIGFASKGNVVGFQAVGDFQILGGKLVFDNYIVPGNGAGGINVYCTGETAAGKGGFTVADTGPLHFAAGRYHIAAGGNISSGCDGGHSGESAAFHAGSAVGEGVTGYSSGTGNVFAGNISISM